MAQRKTLLIVDDDQDLRGAIAEQLQAEAFDTVEADTGALGIRRAVEARPDVILLDVVLGDEDGLALIAPLHRSAEVAIVVLTSLVDPCVAVRAQRLGAVTCVHKSAPAADLLVCIARACANFTLPASTPP